MDDKKIFELLLENHTEKKIVSCCKKIIKKFSFNSGNDAENLCHLAYWLYVYGYEDEALEICKFSHKAEFPGKGIFRVWDFILFIWGLEIQILKEKEQYDQADEIIKMFDDITHKSDDYTEESGQKRRLVFTLDYCANRDKINIPESKNYKNSYRFTSLFHLIGYGSTGLFANLEKDKELVDKTIEEYIEELKN